MTLILHAGAREVTFAELSAVPTPEPTATHLPVPHHQLVELARYALGFYKHEIVDEHHAVMPDGARYFGVMTLRSPHGDYSDVVGLRNSHDKSFPIGIAFGSRVFVCDNTAFVGDHVIRRKHTAKAKRDLPGLLGEIIAPLQDGRVAQHEKMLRYQNTTINRRDRRPRGTGNVPRWRDQPAADRRRAERVERADPRLRGEDRLAAVQRRDFRPGRQGGRAAEIDQ